MAAQFAGSRSLDERRRRRLATESDEAASEPIVAPIPRRIPAAKAPIKQRGPSHFPLRKAISSRLWKHAGVALLGLGLSVGILAGGFAAQTHPARLGPGLTWFLDLSAARLVRWYVVVGPVSGESVGLARVVAAIAKPAGLQGRVSRLGLLRGLGISRGLRDPDRRVSSLEHHGRLVVARRSPPQAGSKLARSRIPLRAARVAVPASRDAGLSHEPDALVVRGRFERRHWPPLRFAGPCRLIRRRRASSNAASRCWPRSACV